MIQLTKDLAESLLQDALQNCSASFRRGQWEAIDTIVNHRKKLLVVERTGWGKSSVYFITTKVLRNSGAGPTVIVSPLLALMRNQVDAAANLGLHAITLNSTNRDDWPTFVQQIGRDEVDCLLISPETLNNEAFLNEAFNPIADRIGLLVVDEAHCISDWGHDFRPDYRRILNILRQLPDNMPVLGTTATANDRVIDDISAQLGQIEIQRGPLLRRSLTLQNIVLPDQVSRLTWLSEHIPKTAGTGIVYALTKRDVLQVTTWLCSQGVDAAAYFSDVTHKDFESSDGYRQHLESQLLSNQVKVLVATSALGMGYDKPDLSFVFHYQAPGNIISYYQQVGRAGRGITDAYGVLLSGTEDSKIHRFFRKSAFPNEEQIQLLLERLEESDGLSAYKLQESLNLSKGNIEKVLKFLSVENPAPVIKQGSKWMRTAVPFQLDHERIAHLTTQREIEWVQMEAYINASDCLMQFLGDALDDPHSESCGRCANCTGQPHFADDIDRQKGIEAARHLKESELPFKPKVQIPANAFTHYPFRGNLPLELRNEEGRILSRWADAGWGGLVEEDKNRGHIRDELIDALAEMILLRWSPLPEFGWITCIPSLNTSQIVPDVAKRLADELAVPFVEVIQKTRANEQQKFQQNRFHQCRNLDGVFAVDQNLPEGAVLLIDDVIDSGWTVTVAGALLRSAGCPAVYPVALATTSTSV